MTLAIASMAIASNNEFRHERSAVGLISVVGKTHRNTTTSKRTTAKTLITTIANLNFSLRYATVNRPSSISTAIYSGTFKCATSTGVQTDGLAVPRTFRGELNLQLILDQQRRNQWFQRFGASFPIIASRIALANLLAKKRNRSFAQHGRPENPVQRGNRHA
jgi:hypothetical protein